MAITLRLRPHPPHRKSTLAPWHQLAESGAASQIQRPLRAARPFPRRAFEAVLLPRQPPKRPVAAERQPALLRG